MSEQWAWAVGMGWRACLVLHSCDGLLAFPHAHKVHLKRGLCVFAPRMAGLCKTSPEIRQATVGTPPLHMHSRYTGYSGVLTSISGSAHVDPIESESNSPIPSKKLPPLWLKQQSHAPRRGYRVVQAERKRTKGVCCGYAGEGATKESVAGTHWPPTATFRMMWKRWSNGCVRTDAVDIAGEVH